MFSVIVPVYNVEPYLRTCIDSILVQTYQDFELILVDDGSTDRCPDICDRYAEKDSRVKVLHLNNGGVSRARNKGLDIASGTYIAFCDSDDWWEPQLLERMYSLLETGQWDWVSFQYKGVWPDGTASAHQYKTGEVEVHNWQDKMQFLLTEFLRCRYGWEIWARIFRADVIQQNHIRFCETCGNYAEDMDFCVKYFLCTESFLSVEDCLYNYFHRDNSMMASSANMIKLNELNEVSYDVCSFAKEHMPEEVYENAVGILHYQILYNQLSHLFYKKEFRDFKQYVKGVRRQTWFRKGAIAVIKNRCIIESLYGKKNAQLIVNLAFFCLHKCWNLYAGVKRLLKKKGEKG